MAPLLAEWPDTHTLAVRELDMSEISTRVHAIVVTFNPVLERLALVLEALRPQVEAVVIVDNGSDGEVIPWLRTRQAESDVTVHALGENLGIAAALNRGIDHALSRGATHLLLMDHDSIAAPDMVATLLAAEEELLRHGVPVAAVGPRFRDASYSAPAPFIRVRGLRVERIRCTDGMQNVEVDYLITSGSLVRAEAIRRVGLMDERLFVDYVDLEWGLRAGAAGFASYGCCAAVLDHQLGDRVQRFLWREVPVRSPLRHYYLIRNACLLYRRPYVPAGWKFVDGSRLPLKLVYYSLFAAPRRAQIRMMFTGLLHGLMNKGGPYPGTT